MLDVHDLEAQLNSKCGGRLLAQGKVLRGIIFREWLQVVHKKKKALKRWKHQALVQMFTDWAGLCAGTQFTSFTSAKVQMLTQKLQSAGSGMRACRTSVRALPRVLRCSVCLLYWNKVQILTLKALQGAWRDLCFHAWAAAVLKDRRARARFVNATLYMCLSSWKALSRELKRQVQVLEAARP